MDNNKPMLNANEASALKAKLGQQHAAQSANAQNAAQVDSTQVAKVLRNTYMLLSMTLLLK